MDAILMQRKARELCERISNPNLCYECWSTTESLTDLTLFAAFRDGNPASCKFLVCHRCRTSGSPRCQKMLETVCSYLHPIDVHEPGERWLDLESAEELVLMAYHRADLAAAMAGKIAGS